MKKYTRASLTSGLVGIWWYTDDGILFGVSTTLDSGYDDGNYIQYSDTKNHLNLFKQCLYDSFDSNTASQLYRLGYKGIERGRVIHNLKTQSYEITCSRNLLYNLEFRQAILNNYELVDCRYDFIQLNHYSKLPLTGNPAIDKFNYEEV